MDEFCIIISNKGRFLHLGAHCHRQKNYPGLLPYILSKVRFRSFAHVRGFRHKKLSLVLLRPFSVLHHICGYFVAIKHGFRAPFPGIKKNARMEQPLFHFLLLHEIFFPSSSVSNSLPTCERTWYSGCRAIFFPFVPVENHFCSGFTREK